MQILSIHLKNIKSHRDREITFSSGINVLSGPNGVGKSTIFEAIGYCLFGVDAKDFVSNVDRFLSIGAKKGEISVTFLSDDGETYRVSRTVGAAAKWLLAKEIGGSFEVEDHARLEETEARVAELLGLANGRPLAEQFKLVIGPFQNDFLGPFVIKQPTKRQEAFDEILGIDAWRKTYKGTSGLLSAVQERLKILAVEVSGKQEQLAVLPDKIKERAAIQEDTILRQQQLKEKDAALAILNGRLEELELREKAVTALNGEVKILENRIKDGTVKVGEQQQRVEQSQTALSVVEQSKAGKEAFEKIEASLELLRKQEQQRRIKEQEIGGLEKEVIRLSQLLSHERTEIEKIDTQLNNELEKLSKSRVELQPDPQLSASASNLTELRTGLEALRGQRSLLDGRRESLLEGKEKLGEGVCPFFQEQCRTIAGTAPRDLFSSRIDELARQASDLDEKIVQTRTLLKDAEVADKELNNRAVRLRELEKQLVALEERRNQNRKRSEGLETIIRQQTEAAKTVESGKFGLKAFAELDAHIAEAEKLRLQYQPARDAYTANLNLASELEARQQQLQKMVRLLEELSAELRTKQVDLAKQSHEYQPTLLLELRKEKDVLLADLATLRQQLLELKRTADRLEKEIGQLTLIQTEIEAKQSEIRKFEDKEKLVKFLRDKVFKNVSTQLSERFREEISLRADRIYRTIAESDEELYWGDNYQIILKDMQDGNIRERSDDQLSGGQMMSAVVALRLALLQTIGARIAFFDEPTSNLDAARRENLAHAFRAIDVGREEVTEHWYDQLFLVSHDVAFSEITDQLIHFTTP